MANSREPVDSNTPREAKSSFESRIEQAMELYLDQLESGTAPDRATFLAQFPDLADELAHQLEALDFLHVATPDLVDTEDEPSDSNPMFFENSRTLGDFRLVRQIGRGGMGIVYEAMQLSLDRRVAVKILPFAAMFDANQRKRFKNEARAAATLDHPNIVPIHFVGQERGVHFYVMQLIEGQSLLEVIRRSKSSHGLLDRAEDRVRGSSSRLAAAPSSDRGKQKSSAAQSATTQPTHRTTRTSGDTSKSEVPHTSPAVASFSTQSDRPTSQYFRSVAELGIQIARALQHAHEQGIVHRDIKPANLLLDETGKVWITDFGLARFETSEPLTGHGEVVGTAAYMSPEQISGSSLVDARSDIYSLAVTLQELAALSHAEDSKSKTDRREKGSDAALRLRNVGHEIPNDLGTILAKAMDESPLDRYQSAGAFADDLQRFVSGRSVLARRRSWGDRAMKWVVRHQRVAAAIGMATALLVAVLLASTVMVWRAGDRAQKALNQSEERAKQIQDLLYLADMQVAYEAWNNGQVVEAARILDRYLPEAGKVDRRGYEWFALHTLVRQVEPTVIGMHQGAANQLAVYPDGRRVASVGDDRVLRVWDLESKQQLLVVPMGDSSVEPLFSVAVSPDGKTLATGSDCVQLWDAETGTRKRLLTTFDYNVQAIAFSPDGKQIAAAARYDQIRLFSTEGKLTRTIEGKARHRTLEFTPDSQRLVVPSRREVPGLNSQEGFIRVWSSDLTQVSMDIAPRRENHLFDTKYTVASCSPDGRLIAISEEKTLRNPVRLIDATSGREVLQLEQRRDEIRSIAFSPDTQLLAVGYLDGNIAIWNLVRSPSGALSAPSKKQTLYAHEGELTTIRFAGPRRLLSCGRDGYVKSWDLPTAANPELVQPAYVAELAVAADVPLIGLQSYEEIHLRHPQDQRFTKLTGAKGTAPTISHDGQLVAAISKDDNRSALRVWETKSGRTISSIPNDMPFSDLEFSPTNDHVTSLDQIGQIVTRSTTDWQIVGQRSLFGELRFRDYRCRYSPDGMFILCVGSDELVIVDSETLTPEKRISISSPIGSLDFCRSTSLVAGTCSNGLIQLWNWPDLKHCGTLTGHVGRVMDVGFTPRNGLVSVGEDGTTRVWSTKHLRCFGVLVDRDHEATSLRVTQDGTQIYVGYNSIGSGEPGLSITGVDLPSEP